MTVNIYDMADTWDNVATTFTSIKMNVTDTASAAASLLMDFQVGGISKFSVSKTGAKIGFTDISYGAASITAIGARMDFSPGAASGAGKGSIDYAGRLCAVSTLQIGSVDQANAKVVLNRDADDILALRRSTNAQTSRIYGTWTDVSNGRWLEIGVTTAGVASIAPTGNGTGAAGNVLHISGLPTSNPGPGILWDNAGTPAIGT